MTTVTGKVKAYLSEYCGVGPEHFANPEPGMVGKLQYFNGDFVPTGWTLAGEATITLELVSQDALVGNKVESLREELRKHRVESHAKAALLEDKISKLLAITHEPSEA